MIYKLCKGFWKKLHPLLNAFFGQNVVLISFRRVSKGGKFKITPLRDPFTTLTPLKKKNTYFSPEGKFYFSFMHKQDMYTCINEADVGSVPCSQAPQQCTEGAGA